MPLKNPTKHENPDNNIERNPNHKKVKSNYSKDIEGILVANTTEFLNKYYSTIIENLWVPGYYFNKNMIEKLFSNKGLTMIDFKKTLYHKSTFLREECMVLDEKSYGKNKKHTYNAKINEGTKTIEIYIDGLNNGEPNYSIKYDEKPDENGFNILKKLNTLYILNTRYENTCSQIGSSKRSQSYFFKDRERCRIHSENIDKNFDILKDIDHTITMKDEEYKDYMIQLTEFTYLNKGTISDIYHRMSKYYIEGTIEKKKEMDELAKEKIKLFENSPIDGDYFGAGIYNQIKGVRPYILLKYLEVQAEKANDNRLNKHARYIGSIKPEDMDPNDERIKEINLSQHAFVVRFMSRP